MFFGVHWSTSQLLASYYTCLDALKDQLSDHRGP